MLLMASTWGELKSMVFSPREPTIRKSSNRRLCWLVKTPLNNKECCLRERDFTCQQCCSFHSPLTCPDSHILLFSKHQPRTMYHRYCIPYLLGHKYYYSYSTVPESGWLECIINMCMPLSCPPTIDWDLFVCLWIGSINGYEWILKAPPLSPTTTQRGNIVHSNVALSSGVKNQELLLLLQKVK